MIVKDQEKDLKTNDDSEKEVKSTLDPNGLKVENKISEGLVNSKLAKTEADQHGLNEFGNLLNSAMQKVKDAPEGMKNIPRYSESYSRSNHFFRTRSKSW